MEKYIRHNSCEYDEWKLNAILLNVCLPCTLSYDAMTLSGRAHYNESCNGNDERYLMSSAYEANIAIIKMMNKGVE